MASHDMSLKEGLSFTEKEQADYIYSLWKELERKALLAQEKEEMGEYTYYMKQAHMLTDAKCSVAKMKVLEARIKKASWFLTDFKEK